MYSLPTLFDEFKADAVDLVITSGRPFATVASELARILHDGRVGCQVRGELALQGSWGNGLPDECHAAVRTALLMRITDL